MGGEAVERPINRSLVLAILSGGAVLVNIDLSAVNVALDEIQSDLDLGVDQLAWVLNGYTLVFASFIAAAGRLGDLRGRRWALVVGVVIFTTMSAIGGLATAGWWLIAARAVQGAGAAFVFPAMLAIIAVVFPGKERAVAVGTILAVAGASQGFGPAIGGALTEFAGWRWVFFVNVPVGAAVVVAARRWVPESRDEKAEPSINWLGAGVLTLALAAIAVGLDQAGTWGWASPYTIASVVIGAALLTGFVQAEYRVGAPLIGPELLENRNFMAANGAGALLYFVFFPLLMYLALFLQDVVGFSAFEAGLGLVPLVIVTALLSRPLARLAARTGGTPIMTTGFALIAVGTAWLAWTADVGSSYLDLIGPIVVSGSGIAFAVALNASVAVGSVDPSRAGAAAGVNFGVRLMGAVVGLALFTTLFAGHDASGASTAEAFVDSWRTPMFMLAGAAVAGAVVNQAFVKDPERVVSHPG